MGRDPLHLAHLSLKEREDSPRSRAGGNAPLGRCRQSPVPSSGAGIRTWTKQVGKPRGSGLGLQEKPSSPRCAPQCPAEGSWGSPSVWHLLGRLYWRQALLSIREETAKLLSPEGPPASEFEPPPRGRGRGRGSWPMPSPRSGLQGPHLGNHLACSVQGSSPCSQLCRPP